MSSALAGLVAEYHIDGDVVAAQVRGVLDAAAATPPLTEAERAILAAGGLDMSAAVDPGRELVRGLADAAEIRRGYTAAEVAANNGVRPGRVRAWAAAGDLIAVKLDGRNRFPRFQFDGHGRRIPGLAAVSRHKPRRWSWQVWRNFLTRAHPAYARPDGQPGTALEWLAAGGDPQTVITMTRVGW
jgi:hypothetical protein